MPAVNEYKDGVVARLYKGLQGLVGEGKLDLDRATAGAPALFLTATDAVNCRGRVARPTRQNLVPWLRAALAFPAGYHKEVNIDGVRYVDGGVALPVAFDVPELDPFPGPTVVVLTRRATTSKPAPRWYERLLVKMMVPRVAHHAVLEQHELHNATMQRLAAAEKRGDVIVSNPPLDMPISRFTTHEGRVRRGIEMGLIEGRAIARRLDESES